MNQDKMLSIVFLSYYSGECIHRCYEEPCKTVGFVCFRNA